MATRSSVFETEKIAMWMRRTEAKWRTDRSNAVMSGSYDGFDLSICATPDLYRDGMVNVYLGGRLVKADNPDNDELHLKIPFTGTVNVHDMEQFHATDGGDQLDAESVALLQQRVDEVVTGHLRSVENIASYSDFARSDKQPLFIWALQYANTMKAFYGLEFPSRDRKEALYNRCFISGSGSECSIVDLVEEFEYLPLVFTPGRSMTGLQGLNDSDEPVRKVLVADAPGKTSDARDAAERWGLPTENWYNCSGSCTTFDNTH